MAKLVLVRGDDWEGIYVDGTLVTEGHSTETIAAIEIAVAHHVTECETQYADLAWLHDEGNLPRRLDEVKLQGHAK